MTKGNGRFPRFTMLPLDLLTSEVWRNLNLDQLRVVFRLMMEHERHYGRRNGDLAVTRRQFTAYGVSGSRVASVIRDLEALGLIEVYGSGAPLPSTYRLMWLPDPDGKWPPKTWLKPNKTGPMAHPPEPYRPSKIRRMAHPPEPCADKWLESMAHPSEPYMAHPTEPCARKPWVICRPKNPPRLRLMSLIESTGVSIEGDIYSAEHPLASRRVH